MPSTQTQDRTELLPSDVLRGKSLGISVSESPDLSRLGVFEDQLKMALGELTRAVIVAGGALYYGGHMREDGYTRFLIEELQRYGRRDKPLKVCLAWTEHRLMSQNDIVQQRRLIGLFGEIIFLSSDGNRLAEADLDEVDPNFSAELKASSLTSLRKFMTSSTDARILLGGRRSGFQGSMPGIVEEALISLEHRQPLYLAGGFGGATLDIVNVLRADNASWFTRAATEQPDPRLAEGLRLIRELVDRTGWDGMENGLSVEENRLLAASYRPSEVAALVGLGMGRLLT